MKVLNLRCALDHGFEGWFGSEADFLDQQQRGAIACPLCGDTAVARMPSAPRLNLSGAREPAAPRGGAVPETAAGRPAPVRSQADPAAAALQARWLQAVQQVIDQTEDVGARFTEEARRIHYGEADPRGIRGQASAAQCAELADEGITVLPLPAGRSGPVH